MSEMYSAAPRVPERSESKRQKSCSAAARWTDFCHVPDPEPEPVPKPGAAGAQPSLLSVGVVLVGLLPALRWLHAGPAWRAPAAAEGATKMGPRLLPRAAASCHAASGQPVGGAAQGRAP